MKQAHWIFYVSQIYQNYYDIKCEMHKVRNLNHQLLYTVFKKPNKHNTY